jgi:hypothetical protein
VEASKPDFQPPLTEIEKGYVEGKEEAEFEHEIGNIFTGEKETERKKA